MRFCFFFAISAYSSSSLRRSVDAGQPVSLDGIVDELESEAIYEISDASGDNIQEQDSKDSWSQHASDVSTVSETLTPEFLEEMEPWFSEENVDGATRSFLATFSEKNRSAMLKDTRKGLAVGILLAFLLEIAASKIDLSEHFGILGKLDIKSVRGALLLIDFVLRGVLHWPQLVQRLKQSSAIRYLQVQDDDAISSLSSEEESNETVNEGLSFSTTPEILN